MDEIFVIKIIQALLPWDKEHNWLDRLAHFQTIHALVKQKSVGAFTSYHCLCSKSPKILSIMEW